MSQLCFVFVVNFETITYSCGREFHLLYRSDRGNSSYVASSHAAQRFAKPTPRDSVRLMRHKFSAVGLSFLLELRFIGDLCKSGFCDHLS